MLGSSSNHTVLEKMFDLIQLLKIFPFTMRGQQRLSKKHRRLNCGDNFVIIANISKTVLRELSLN